MSFILFVILVLVVISDNTLEGCYGRNRSAYLIAEAAATVARRENAEVVHLNKRSEPVSDCVAEVSVEVTCGAFGTAVEWDLKTEVTRKL